MPRNPTPGPAGDAFLYGHVWVTLAVLVWHSQYGIWAFLLLSRFFIPKGQISKVPADGDVRFAPRWKWRRSCSSWLPPGGRKYELTQTLLSLVPLAAAWETKLGKHLSGWWSRVSTGKVLC